MHILLAILGALAAAAFFVYRLYMAIQISRKAADTVGDPRRFVRRFRWARKVRNKPLETIDDPREAATVLMLAVARTEGDLSDAGRAAVRRQMCRHFQMPEGEAESMLRQMAWLTREITDIGPRMRRLVTLLQRRCTAAETEDLADMMEAVAERCGGLTSMRRQLIDRYRRILREQSGPATGT